MKGRRLLTRRGFLGGAAALVGLPWLEALAPRAARAAEPAESPTRLVWYFVPNGVRMPEFRPIALAGGGWQLSEILAPLADVRSEVSVLSGLSNHAVPYIGDAPHTVTAGSFLTAVPIEEDAGGIGRNGISCDQVAANALGGATRFRSLELGAAGEEFAGVCEQGRSCAYLESIAWAGPKTPLPKLSDPRKAFERLFGGLDPAASAAELARRRAERSSVLDLVLGQANALRAKLGSADRTRLEQYADGIRDLERRLETGAEISCDVPAQAPEEPLSTDERVDAMHRLLVLALQCDQTRVATFMFDNAFSNPVYGHLGLNEGYHDLSHHLGSPEKIAALVAINSWQVQHLAALLKMLSDVDEGGGTLLDNTLLCWSSSISDGNGHDPHNLPVILAGRGGGTVEPGRHLTYFAAPRADLWIAMLQAAGVQIDRFGAYGTGPLPGLVG